jgi:hypothetical protein
VLFWAAARARRATLAGGSGMALFFLAATRMFFLIVLGVGDGEKNREGFGAVLREFSLGGWRWGKRRTGGSGCAVR